MLKLLLIAVCVILLIILIILYNSGDVIDDFANTTGHASTAQSRRAYRVLQSRDNPTPQDYYMAATIALYNEHVPNQARIYMTDAIAGLQQQRNITLTNDYAPELILDAADNFDIQAALIENARDNIAAVRKKTQPQEQFYDRTVASDPQNVHDSNVNFQCDRKYRQLLALNRDIPDVPDEYITEQVAAHPNARRVWERVSRNPAYIGRLNTTDYAILKEIWKRAQNQQQQPIIDAMNSCVENDHIICTGGRVNRFIDSLTSVDPNPIIAKPIVTTSILRREALAKSYKIIQSELANQPEALRVAYNTADDHPDMPQLEMQLKQAIANRLRRDYPDADPTKLNEIITEAQRGV